MKILHFISATGPSAKLTTLYASTLVDALKPAAEVMLIDGESLPPSQYKKQAQDFNPDILHIHTCWDMPTSQMARWAHISNKPVVLSPHGALEPWITNQRYLQEKLPKLLLYQHQTICNADAIVVAGPMEQQALTNLSWSRAKDIEIDTEETDSTTDTPTGKKSRQPWNDRVCIIKNSITTNDITTEQMASQMMLLYRKVIDTNAGMLMSPEARLAEDGLLRVGISRSERSNTITPEQTEAIARLDDESWRKLFLHAQDEDVLHLVKKAIDEMQLNAPHIVIEDIDRFPQRLPKTRGPLNCTTVADKSLRSAFKPWEELHGGAVEMDFCRMTANIQHELRKATLSLRHLTDIYQLLRFTEMDEELICRILKDTELYQFTRQLQQTLSQRLGLSEGFMPIQIEN